ncbi:MAG: PaaI family thioesterase, partial [Helicobacteraceae bacterium]|nr:PaaI family thioesterase [Helicobacteraceae bacterium]
MADDEEYQEEQEVSAVPTDSREHLDLKTHAQINQNLCGFIEDIQDGYAKVRLVASEEMIVDKRGMIHAGFLFNAASFAAIAAINKPNVVLVVARCNFLAAL